MPCVIIEGYINTSVIPVSIKNTEKILDQMKKCVCKIHNKGKKGTGFFSRIEYKYSLKNVLITNNYILNKNDIETIKKITISLNNEQEFKDIELDNERLIFTDEMKDITIIEIKEKDNINNYLDIDERYNKDRIKERHNNESLYVLNYPKGENMVV